MLANFKPYPTMKDSDVKWLGEVPEHWQVSMTKRHYDIQLGKMLQSTPSGADDVEVPYLKAKDVQWFRVQVTNTSTMWASLAELDQFGITPGDLLVCEGGEGGRCGILKHKVDGYIIQNALHRVRPRLESRNGYLQYVMMSVAATSWFEALNDKATIAHFTREKFGSLGIPIPSGDEQAAIVLFLDHADRLIQRYIRAKEKVVALLEEQKQAIIREAVTGQIDVRTGKTYPAYKPSGVAWLGNVPVHWEVAALRHRYLQCLGKMLDSKRITGNHSLPYLRNVDVQWDQINIENLPTMDIPPDEYDRYTVQQGDLLVCEGGEVGRCALWSGGLTRCGFQKALHRLRPRNPGRDLPRFVYYVLRTAVEGNAFRDGQLSTIAHLTGDKLRAHRFPFPPIAEQESVASFLDAVSKQADSAISNTRREIELMGTYRTRLIADVATGKIDVREAAAALPEEPGLSGNDRAEVEDAVGIQTEALEMTDWETCPAVERKPGKVSGAWVFAGTRIPLSALYENLASGATINEFVEWFPGVDEQQVRAVLEHEAKALRTATAT